MELSSKHPPGELYSRATIAKSYSDFLPASCTISDRSRACDGCTQCLDGAGDGGCCGCREDPTDALTMFDEPADHAPFTTGHASFTADYDPFPPPHVPPPSLPANTSSSNPTSDLHTTPSNSEPPSPSPGPRNPAIHRSTRILEHLHRRFHRILSPIHNRKKCEPTQTQNQDMELAQSLLLNEDALSKITPSKRPIFVFEWLRFLDKVLVAAQKSDIKSSQKTLVSQLRGQLSKNPGPPTRKLIAKCLAGVFSVGDAYCLHETINHCNDLIRNRDDSPSYLLTKLAAICCIGILYEKLGRLVGRSYDETISLLIKSLKNAESQGRCETMLTLKKIIGGLGSAGTACYKDVYKSARICLTDRSMIVRASAAMCLYELVDNAPFVMSHEVDSLVSQCYKAFEDADYSARCETGRLLGHLLSSLLTAKPSQAQLNGKAKIYKVEDILNILTAGFVRGGTGFLKGSTAGDMIKGISVSRDIHVGVTYAYVHFLCCMGGAWLEAHGGVVTRGLFELAGHQRATPTHIEAVYTRACIQHIARTTFHETLTERAQAEMARHVCNIVQTEMNIVENLVENDSSDLTSLCPHILVCALTELGHLLDNLGTSVASSLVSDPSNGILEPVLCVLTHPSNCVRLNAALCIRRIAISACPSQSAVLIDRCNSRLKHNTTSAESISGYGYCLATLIAGVSTSALGIPLDKYKKVFNIAKDLLMKSTQNTRLSLSRTQSGWLLLSSLMTMDTSQVKSYLPQLMSLWRNAFPRSVRELEAELKRGDGFTWQVTLEARAGALAVMRNFLHHCPSLVTEDVVQRLLKPLECALTMLTHMPDICKLYGTHLKSNAALVRLRLYSVLNLLPPKSYEGAFNSLLRELVAEFTLTENANNTTTSLLSLICNRDESAILGCWPHHTQEKHLEDQLLTTSSAGSGSMEHDSLVLVSKNHLTCEDMPLPLGVCVIDESVRVFGRVFGHVQQKHRQQMLQHFAECARHARSAERKQAVQINVFAALVTALKNLAEDKLTLSHDNSVEDQKKMNNVKQSLINLITDALTATNPQIRCAAAEALGRLIQVVGDPLFTASMIQFSFDKLKNARDVITRTGHSLALGCMHRSVGSMASGQHISTSISVLLALAQDSTSPVVQVWSLHGLALIADSGGPMFRTFVEPTLSLVLNLLLSVAASCVDVHRCLGRCLAALITTIGPELQGNTSIASTVRLSCLVCCAALQDHYNELVRAEAIYCLQQCHLFAPRHVNLATLVPHLCVALQSEHLLLRKAAVSCLRQLAQRESQQVCEHAQVSDQCLEMVMFTMLDTSRGQLRSHICDTLNSLLQVSGSSNKGEWPCIEKRLIRSLDIIKTILLSSSDNKVSSKRPLTSDNLGQEQEEDDLDDVYAGDGVSLADPQGTIGGGTGGGPGKAHQVTRWRTRVFAIQCLRKALAQPFSDTDIVGKTLISHLSDLVKMSFIAAISECDQLRLSGLAMLQEIIQKFCTVAEPDFPGHNILEQYQAQVGAALRPAFSSDTAPDITAAACEVCSAWLSSGVAKDLKDLRRVHVLLVESLGKTNCDGSLLYSDCASTMEKLGVLKAWAQVYMVAVEREIDITSSTDDIAAYSRAAFSRASSSTASTGPTSGSTTTDTTTGDTTIASSGSPETAAPSVVVDPSTAAAVQSSAMAGQCDSLLDLVQPQMKVLAQRWLAVLKDYALLSLPDEYSSQLPSKGGTFYSNISRHAAKSYYVKTWPSVMYAVSLWLRQVGFTKSTRTGDLPANVNSQEHEYTCKQQLHLMLGICVHSLCSHLSTQTTDNIVLSIRSVCALLDDPWPREQLSKDRKLCVEILNVLHRIILTRESEVCVVAVFTLVKSLLKCFEELRECDLMRRTEAMDQQKAGVADEGEREGEGEGETGTRGNKNEEDGENSPSDKVVVCETDLESDDSLVYATLETCICALLKRIPSLAPNLSKTGLATKQQNEINRLTSSSVILALDAMVILPGLCSNQATTDMLPTLLYLFTKVIRVVSLYPDPHDTLTPALTSMNSLFALHHPANVPSLQSALFTLLSFMKPDDNFSAIPVEVLLRCLGGAVVCGPCDLLMPGNVREDVLDVFADALAIGAGNNNGSVSGAEQSRLGRSGQVGGEMVDGVVGGTKGGVGVGGSVGGVAGVGGGVGGSVGGNVGRQRVPVEAVGSGGSEAVGAGAVYSEALRQLISVVTCEHTRGDVRSSFVRRCAPEIVSRLADFARTPGDQCATSGRSRLNEFQVLCSVKLLSIIAEHSTTMETRVHIVTILVPILIKLLEAKVSRDLYSKCLKQLLQIAAEMPSHFKQIIASAPSLKLTLETAIRADTLGKKQKLSEANMKNLPSKPSIQLKTNFANFA